MYLSRLRLDPRDRSARRDLASPYDLHRTLLTRGFGGAGKDAVGRLLFRLDADEPGRPVVLVQSGAEPDWAGLPQGYLAGPADSKPYDPRFRAGQRLWFRLRANPAMCVAAGNPALGPTHAGKRIGLKTEAAQVRWLLGKAAAGGFSVPGDWDGGEPRFEADARPEGRVRNGKGGGWFLSVRFDGRLTVGDPAAFRATLEAGVGPAKGYGFGLLSVAPD